MLQPVFLLILLLIAAAPVSGQQSQVQRCEAMKNSGDAATREYCLGIFAASGPPQGETPEQTPSQM
jgi:hypothetical protein